MREWLDDVALLLPSSIGQHFREEGRLLPLVHLALPNQTIRRRCYIQQGAVLGKQLLHLQPNDVLPRTQFEVIGGVIGIPREIVRPHMLILRVSRVQEIPLLIFEDILP
jgi:hypothetical protein